MWGAIVKIVASVVGVGTQWLDGKQKITTAKVDREVKALTHEANWDEVQAENSGNSWKDEWLTLLVSIPMVMAFFPGMVEYVEAGFEVLEKMPTWYQYLVGVVFAASFGIKALAGKLSMKK